jgi:hypothetical protein
MQYSHEKCTVLSKETRHAPEQVGEGSQLAIVKFNITWLPRNYFLHMIVESFYI